MPLDASTSTSNEAPSSGTPGTTWKLVLSYDGSDFNGWQVQPGLLTVQGELAAAIERVTGEQVLPQGSGRTDAGVHALAQVASMRLDAPIPPGNLVRALNRTLPPSIRVLDAQRMTIGFHARHSATSKTYEYRIFRGEICPPFLARYVYCYTAPLDGQSMQSAAAMVLGEHDFASFAATEPDRTQRTAFASRPEDPAVDAPDRKAGHPARGNVRLLLESGWRKESSPDGDLLIYRVRGDGFLHHMVRNLVGTFLDAGRGLIDAGAIQQVLAAKARHAAGPTAPSRGLFLVSVGYDATDELAASIHL
ncbi:MAG TPA: tRNA pseudouridine synthase A [Acidisarcina sp.]